MKETAARCGVSVRTLLKWRDEKKGPPWFKIGKAVRYREDELDAWIEAQRGK